MRAKFKLLPGPASASWCLFPTGDRDGWLAVARDDFGAKALMMVEWKFRNENRSLRVRKRLCATNGAPKNVHLNTEAPMERVNGYAACAARLALMSLSNAGGLF